MRPKTDALRDVAKRTKAAIQVIATGFEPRNT